MTWNKMLWYIFISGVYLRGEDNKILFWVGCTKCIEDFGEHGADTKYVVYAYLRVEDFGESSAHILLFLRSDKYVGLAYIGAASEQFLEENLAHEACSARDEHAAVVVEIGNGRHVGFPRICGGWQRIACFHRKQ